MKREREAVRLLRKAADVLEGRRVTASMSKRARRGFPYTEEQIEGLHRYFEELVNREKEKLKRAFEEYLHDLDRWEEGKGNFYHEPAFFGDGYYPYPFPLNEEFDVGGFTIEIVPEPKGEPFEDGVIYNYYVYLTLGEPGDEESVQIGTIYMNFWDYRARMGYDPKDYEDIVAQWRYYYGGED